MEAPDIDAFTVIVSCRNIFIKIFDALVLPVVVPADVLNALITFSVVCCDISDNLILGFPELDVCVDITLNVPVDAELLELDKDGYVFNIEGLALVLILSSKVEAKSVPLCTI